SARVLHDHQRLEPANGERRGRVARAREVVRLDPHHHGAHVSPPLRGGQEDGPARARLTRAMREHTVRLVAATTERGALAPGTRLPEQRVRARNLFRDAANRIHDDAVARQHGYAGALVAGVTIYGYLTRLAVMAWGPEWLRRGTASVRFLRPVYDGDSLAMSGQVVARSAAETAGESVIEIQGRTPRDENAVAMAAGLAW